MGDPKLQMACAEVKDEAGTGYVRIMVGAGPLAAHLTFEPDVAEKWLAWLVENLPGIVTEVRRNNSMKGFQIITDLAQLPKFPPMNGAGGRDG